MFMLFSHIFSSLYVGRYLYEQIIARIDNRMENKQIFASVVVLCVRKICENGKLKMKQKLSAFHGNAKRPNRNHTKFIAQLKKFK